MEPEDSISLVSTAIALREGRPAEVISLVQPAKPYEMRDYHIPTLLGQAYLDIHRRAEA